MLARVAFDSVACPSTGSMKSVPVARLTVQITWRLQHPLPGDVFPAFRATVA